MIVELSPPGRIQKILLPQLLHMHKATHELPDILNDLKV